LTLDRAKAIAVAIMTEDWITAKVHTTVHSLHEGWLCSPSQITWWYISQIGIWCILIAQLYDSVVGLYAIVVCVAK